MIVIGSHSLLFRLSQTEDVKNRLKKADFDVLMTTDEFYNWTELHKEYIQLLIPRSENKFKAMIEKDGIKKQYEIEIGLEGTSTKFLLDRDVYVTDFIVEGFLGEDLQTLTLPYQFLTKKSHIIYPIHFEKNIEDYHQLKSMFSVTKMDESMDEYYSLRFNEAKERYNQKTPKLNVTTEQFFGSKLAVKHYFIHDHIHEVMAHHDEPVYKKMQPDPTSAWCAKDMFFELPEEMQVQAVQEEAYVIALERYIIPQRGVESADFFACYKKALLRICTTLCSGWFRQFAINNYFEAIERYNPYFVIKFINSYKNGQVGLIEGKEFSDVPLFNKEWVYLSA